MEGVSGAFAVVSLTLQLVGTVQSICGILRSIKEAPSEILSLIDTLDNLNDLLDLVKLFDRQQLNSGALPCATNTIRCALSSCERAVRRLAVAVNSVKISLLDCRRFQRSWKSLKFHLKKEEIQGFQNRIRDSTAILHCAITVNSALLVEK